MGKIVVIGSGFGGLATAIRLQASGYEVTIVEARMQAGGRAGQLVEGGYTFDTGPSLITAPELLEDLWTISGRSMADDLQLVSLAPNYRIYFRDGRYFDYGGADDEAQIAKFNPADIPGYHALMAHTQRIYQRAFSDLAEQPFDSMRTFISVVPELLKLRAHRSVYSLVSDYISDEQLRAIFSFHPLFIGGNPLRASAIYSIIPYLERKSGVHFAMGGTYALVSAMVRLFQDLGGRLYLGEPVEEICIRKGQAHGVRTVSGLTLDADAVVANSDVMATYRALVSPSMMGRVSSLRMRSYRHSMSCFLLYLGLSRQYDELLHHTVIMPEDFQGALEGVFNSRQLPQDLALYLHAPSKTDPSLAPPGGESVYVLVPVPNLEVFPVDWSRAAPVMRERILSFLEHRFGLQDLSQHIVVERQFTPDDFANEFGSYAGAAFSLEPTLLQSAYFRPHNRSGNVERLYLTGAGTHPGAGIPGVLLSAKLTSELVLADIPIRQPAHDVRVS